MTMMTLAITGIDKLNTIKLAGEISDIKKLLEYKSMALLSLILKELFESDEKINCVVWCQRVEDPTFSDKSEVQVQDVYVGVGSYINKESLKGMAKEIGFDIYGGRRVNEPDRGSVEYQVIRCQDGIVTPCSTDLVHCANSDFGLSDNSLSEYTTRLVDELNLLVQESLNSFLMSKFGVGCTVIVNRDLTVVSALTNLY